MYLLDTTILVDYLRRYAPAVSFVDSLMARTSAREHERGVISFVTALELYIGAGTKRDQEIVAYLLSRFRVIAAETDTALKSITIMKEYFLTSRIDLADCIIAATAGMHGYILLTRNMKHFSVVEGLRVEVPY